MQFIGAQPTVDLTYSDVFLVPSHSEVGSRLGVDLAPADGTPATLPLVAANMNAVTGPRLAAVLARRGGLGVLPQDMNTEQLVDDRLLAHHHIDRVAQPQAADELLTPTLRRLLAGPRRQTATPRELQRIHTDIEAL